MRHAVCEQHKRENGAKKGIKEKREVGKEEKTRKKQKKKKKFRTIQEQSFRLAGLLLCLKLNSLFVCFVR